MNILAILLAVVYVAFVIYLTHRVVVSLELSERLAFATSINGYQELIEKKRQIEQEKKRLDEEASNIFMLYEMTKDVAKKLDREEAFELFKNKLSDSITFDQCKFLDPLSSDVKKLKSDDNYFIVPLKSKKRNLGTLVISGQKEEDKEKLMILAHQFALALRRIRLYEELEKLAITDSLTELHTRRHFWERFEEELKRSKARKIDFSFLVIDVDHFKKINDQHGHLTGDQILRKMGKIIQDNIREIDIAGRFGGEEFCVVLPDTDSEGAQYVAERIRSTAEETSIKAYDASVKATLSIGVSTFPKDGKKTEEVFDKADWALYRAKKMGRNRICAFGIYDKPS